MRSHYSMYVSHSHTSDCAILGEAQLHCASLQVSLEYFTGKCEYSTIFIANDLNLVKIKYLGMGTSRNINTTFLYFFFLLFFFFLDDR